MALGVPLTGLAGACKQLGEDLHAQQRKAVAQSDRAEAWKLATLGALAPIPVAFVILRYAGF